MENASYEGLAHRRSVWFVDHAFLVMLDEAVGHAVGAVDLRFQFAPGAVQSDTETRSATTRFDDANVLVQCFPKTAVSLREEDGWFAWDYGKRVPRKGIAFRHASGAPAVFLTAVIPYRGVDRPDARLALPAGYAAVSDRVELRAEVGGRAWRLGRDLGTGEAWMKDEG